MIGAISTGSGQPLHLEGVQTLSETGYAQIPGLASSMIAGQEGRLRIVEASDGDWAIWVGRRHFYQGFKYREIGLYLEKSKDAGAKFLLCINAAGGLNPELNVGDFVLINRFRSFIPIDDKPAPLDGSPWRETSEAIRDRLAEAAQSCGIEIKTGAYVGVPGPTYETPADVAWLRSLGCDVVGMSTTPELIRASELGMEICAMSVVANVHGKSEKLSHEDVVRNSMASERNLGSLVAAFLKSGGKS